VCNFDKTEIFTPRAADFRRSLAVICVDMKISSQAHHNASKSRAKRSPPSRARGSPHLPRARSRSLGDSGLRVQEFARSTKGLHRLGARNAMAGCARFSRTLWGG